MSAPSPASGLVKFLPPLQAEKLAYALARYSRSSDPVEDSLAWVDAHSEEAFWKTFYFDYGHASIADLGHVAVCFEGLSELAALEVLDEQVWDGQARSTRYQNFSTAGHVAPPELSGHALEAPWHERIEGLIKAYSAVHAQSFEWLTEKHPKPEEMKKGQYRRNVEARAFDMARYLLPLAIPTNVGQVTSIRTLEKQISRLLASPLSEVRALGEKLVEGCRAEPAGGGQAPAPTLARHARVDEFLKQWRAESVAVVGENFSDSEPSTESKTHIVAETATSVELLAGLLYEAACQPWDALCKRVAALSPDKREGLIKRILETRGRFDELPRATRAGYRFSFEIVMDVGGWRDMHRHRRCQQLLQEFDLDAGCELPPEAVECGIDGQVMEEYEKTLALARQMRDAFGPRVAAYGLPLMHRVRSLFKMDFAEADYIARLRSGIKGHPSYRKVAWDMFQALKAAEPELAFLLDATSPDVEDPLTR